MDRRAHEAALDRLAAIPGVVGAVVFDAAGKVEAAAFPPAFDPAALSRLAGQLTSDAYFQEWLAAAEATLSLRFLDGYVALRSLGGAFALVLCGAQANEQLLAMSLAQFVHRFRAAGSGATRPGGPSAPERLLKIARAELGEHAAKAVEILSAAGEKPAALARAVVEVEQMVRLFISKKKAEELARLMRSALDA